jgi:GNAT superfamily N-acetyltransferase
MPRHLAVPGFQIVPIAADIDRSAFSCGGEPELDQWIQQVARQTTEDRLSATYVLIDGDRICRGYYTVRPITITLENFPAGVCRRWKRGDAPALLLAKMAVAADLQGKGLGSRLLADAMFVALQWSLVAGGAVMIVDAKNPGAKRLYERAGFVPIEGRRLYLPMWHIEKWAKDHRIIGESQA